MFARMTRRPGWRGVLMATGCVGVLVGAGLGIRAALLPHVNAQVAAPAPEPPLLSVPSAPVLPSDYGSRVVAYIHETEPITREELGDYLIDRYGAEKLELLVHKRIVDAVCRQQNIEVTGAEIDAALAEDLQGLSMNQANFVNTVLGKYHKTLFEWKEDVLRTKLQMTKLCRSRVRISSEELQKAFESLYGEKVEGQIIVWENSKQGEQQALADYGQIRDNPDVFDQKAKAQKARPQLAATAGRTKAFGRYMMGDEHFDQVVFRLKPGEISEVVLSAEGPIVFKCLRHYPADTSISVETVRNKLVKELMERKVAAEMQGAFAALLKQAQPEILLQKKKNAEASDGVPERPGVPHSQQTVASFKNRDLDPIAREALGEFLIARCGAQKLEFLINRRVIDKACKARNITVSAKEIDDALADDIKKLGTDKDHFEKEFLHPYFKNLYEWREDVIRPRLLLNKLCRGGVQVTEDELKLAFEAHHGEQLDCRIILWPHDQTKFALAEYTKIRDNPEAFDEAAKHQASTSLAAQGGRLPPFGRHALGDENVEREAFKLQPGEMSVLIGTPQGQVVVKLDKRIPPNTSRKLETEREDLRREVFEKKVQIAMQTAFADLRTKANPKVILKDASKPIDLKAETGKLLEGSPEAINLDRKPLPR